MNPNKIPESHTLREILSDITKGKPFQKLAHHVTKGCYTILRFEDDMPTGKLSMEIMKWITAALNEKYERNFSEPLRWVKDSGYHYCPKYRTVFNDEKCKITPLFEHCPCCAQKLKPPEDVDG
jgi:hypothetical protein